MWWRHILNWRGESHRRGLKCCYFSLVFRGCLFWMQVQNEHMLLVHARWHFHRWLPEALRVQDPLRRVSNSWRRPLLLLRVCGRIPQSKGRFTIPAWGNLHPMDNTFQSLVTTKRRNLNSFGNIQEPGLMDGIEWKPKAEFYDPSLLVIVI